MKRSAFSLRLLSASALLLAHSPFAAPAPQDALVHLEWRAAPDAVLDVHFEHSFDSAFTALEDLLDGKATALTPPPLRWRTEEVYDWCDAYEKVADAEPLTIRRDFDTVARTRKEIQGDDMRTALEFGAVHQQAVRFQRAPDETAWLTTYADPESKADPQALEGLRPQPLFRGFLPSHADVAVGAQWTADLDAWRAVLHPTGLLSFQTEDGSTADDSIDRKIEAALRGTVACTLTDFAADTGLATIEAHLKLESNALFEGELENDDPNIKASAFERKIDYQGDLTIELLWYTRAGRAHSLFGTGEAQWTIAETTEMHFNNGTNWQQGRRMQMQASHVLSASIQMSAAKTASEAETADQAQR